MSAQAPAGTVSAVNLNGTVREGNIGPSIGLLDIGVSDNAYIFRMALPGDLKDPNGLKCEVHHSGKVQIEAEVNGASIKDSSPDNFRLITPQLISSGPFTLSFNLPGPVDARLFTPIARRDGVLEVVVMKSKRPDTPGGPPSETPAAA